MNNFISPLQLYTTRNFNGLTESNHLSNAYLTEPDQVGSVLSLAFGKKDSVISLITGGIGNVDYVDSLQVNNREYQWDLHTFTDRAIEVTGNLGDGGSMPGYSQGTFRVKLAEKWFESTDVLVADDATTQVRIQTEPTQDGTSWVYTFQLAAGDPTKFIDPSLIAQGARFRKDYSVVSELSTKGGGTHFYAPFKLRNQLSILRKEYAVSRSAATDVMIIELVNPDNPKEKTKLWIRNAEWQFLSQWYYELDKHLVYSTFNKDSKTGFTALQGENGRPVYTGAGLREQIAPANKRYYTKLTYDILQEFLIDLSYAANYWGGDYKFLALTGKMGMQEFDKAVRDKIALGGGITVVDNGRFISGSGQDLIFQGQFKTIKFLNGIELTVKEFPVYDDLVRNGGNLHPITKRPIESYRFTILNIGRKDGKSNIRKVVKKGSEIAMWYNGGSINPMGTISKSMTTMGSNTVDGYQVNVLTECGIMVEDPTTMGELIYSLD